MAKNINTKLCLVGINLSGLSSKLDSFGKMLDDLSPSVLVVEETKTKRQGRIQVKNCEKYFIYDLNRK